MLALLIRELKSFFNTLTGYIVVAVFLVVIGLFLWVVPVTYNIPDNGYADLSGLFYTGARCVSFSCAGPYDALFL